jgi:hypothetical protein
MIKICVLVKRRPDLSRAQFIRYYEENHVKLITRLLPQLTGYRRNYICFDDPMTYLGPFLTENDSSQLAKPDFDVISEARFADRASFESFIAALQAPETARLIAEDEENFCDRPFTRVLVVEEHITM